jgi:hypothetical protein
MSPQEGQLVHGIDAGSAESAADRTTPVLVASRVGSVVPRRPRLIRLPIGRRVQIQPVGTTSNGLPDVPADADTAGWWEDGSRLGDPFGSMLVAAHVGSPTRGLGPFASLLTARPGERVRVWGGWLRRTFEIRTRTLRPQETAGPMSWLHSRHGPARLTLVTCAGPYDPDGGGYQNLAVVVAFPIGDVRLRH